MKKLNKFFAVLVALAMMATLCVLTAFAEDETPATNPTTGTDMYITKTLRIPQGLSTVAETFTFNGVLDKVDGNNATNDQKTALNFTTSINYAAGETDSDADGYIRKAVAFDPDTIAFTHAGVYEYTVTETAGTTEGMTYDDASYTVTIRVKNGQDGTPVVDSIVVKDEDGQKVDVDDPGDDTEPQDGQNQAGEKAASGANFTNTYTKIADDTPTDEDDDPETPNDGSEKASFVIDKTVTGDYGDKTKQFNFSLTVDTSKTYVENPTLTYWKYDAEGNKTAATPASFTLADGEKLVVEGAPVGTLYTVTENLEGDTDAAAAKYTASVAVTENGAASDKSVVEANSTEGANLAVTKALVGEAANSANYTNKNTKDDVTPTGILINNLPYIALALVAIGGLVAYVVVRRKDEENA